jgi:hypothetical protein
MGKDVNKEYTINTFRQLCSEAVERLPERAKDESVEWPVRREWALRQLLHEVQRYVNSTGEIQGLPELEEWQRLRVQIRHCLFHSWSITGSKPETVDAVIDDFIQEAVGEASSEDQ